MSKFSNFVAAFVLLGLMTGATVQAQTPVAITVATNANVSTVPPSTPATQIVSSLASLPEAYTLIYINPQRILNEVVPKFMPAKDVESMHQGFEEVRKTRASIPPRSITS